MRSVHRPIYTHRHFFLEINFTGTKCFVQRKRNHRRIASFRCRVCTVQQRAHELFLSGSRGARQTGNAPTPKRRDERRAKLRVPPSFPAGRERGTGTERSPGPGTRWHQIFPGALRAWTSRTPLAKYRARQVGGSRTARPGDYATRSC